MTVSAQELAQNLVDALGEVRAVEAEQKQRAEAARQQADTSQEQFLSFLRAQQSDAADAEAQQRRQRMEQMRSRLSSLGGADRLSDMSALALRRETALCAGQLALMRLYAFSEAQASAERIAELLRSLRLLQIDTPPATPPPAPSLPEGLAENASPGDRQQQKIGFALDFFQGMDGYREKVQQRYQDKIERSDALLEQACQEAEALARRLQA